ncbi:hypothetical protein FOA52_006151 [Chlamydomonas sp. UWO 241]|nr:hypothetical protein FOA52_006151 [Chlamydomonas sp. UWO 241]
MMMHQNGEGSIALTVAVEYAPVDAMRLLLDHPRADPAAMIMHVRSDDNSIALKLAVRGEHNVLEIMRVLLDHPAADPAAMLMHTDRLGMTPFDWACSHSVDAMRLLLAHPAADPAAMIRHTKGNGSDTLMSAAEDGYVDAVHLLLSHPSADPVAMLMHKDDRGCTALMEAAQYGFLDVMQLLLAHPSADPAAAMLHTANDGLTAFILASGNDRYHVGAMRLLLDHPAADAAAMMMHTADDGSDALMQASVMRNVNTVRLLLDHPSADPAAMMLRVRNDGSNALALAARDGHVDAMRLLLDHPSADPVAMMAAHTSTAGASYSALTAAAGFAAGLPRYLNWRGLPRSCAPLLLLLRRFAVESQPCDALRAHMSKVVEALCQGPQSEEMFDDDQPDDARDECVRLLLPRGARGFDSNGPVVSRIICDLAQLASVPQRINDAVVGMAAAWQQTPKPRDSA